MTNQFIEQQKELAKDWYRKLPEETSYPKELGISYSELNILITQIITNTGEELMRLAEGERDDTYPSPTSEPTSEYVARLKERRIVVDTLKKHITNVTGVE